MQQVKHLNRLVSSDLFVDFSEYATQGFGTMRAKVLKTVLHFEGMDPAVVDVLIRYFEAANDDLLKIAIDGHPFKTRAILMSVIDDAFLVIPSIGTVFIICAMVLRRLRFAVAALLILLCALPVGIAVYNVPQALGVESVPILCMLSRFLLLGIGADGIFVYVNCLANAYEDYMERHKQEINSEIQRLREHFQHGLEKSSKVSVVPTWQKALSAFNNRRPRSDELMEKLLAVCCPVSR